MQKLLYRNAVKYLSRQMYGTMITVLEERQGSMDDVKKRIHAQSDRYVYPDLVVITGQDRITIYEPVLPEDQDADSVIGNAKEELVVATLLCENRPGMTRKLIYRKGDAAEPDLPEHTDRDAYEACAPAARELFGTGAYRIGTGSIRGKEIDILFENYPAN